MISTYSRLVLYVHFIQSLHTPTDVRTYVHLSDSADCKNIISTKKYRLGVPLEVHLHMYTLTNLECSSIFTVN